MTGARVWGGAVVRLLIGVAVLGLEAGLGGWAGARAAALYVSTSGSNSNPGTIGRPWRTLQHAFDQLNPGDTLFVRGGTYFEAPKLTRSGTASAPIMIRSYPGETGVIDSGSPLFRTPNNTDWELVDATRGEYRSTQPIPVGPAHAYVTGIEGYENERVALVPYLGEAHFRSMTDQFGAFFYVGPGTFRMGDRVHIRLSKTNDMRAAEARYGTVFDGENVDPRRYAIILSTAKLTLSITGGHLILKDLVIHQADETIRIDAPAHHVTLDGVTVWRGNSAIELDGVHHVKIVRSRIYGDYPYWIFWSDMKDLPAPADKMRGTSIDMSGGTHDVEIAYCHVRGSGNDLIATKNDEFNVFIHHNRLENAGDDALELEGTLRVGRIEIYENYILNSLTAIAPAQSTPDFAGPLLVYRNLFALLRPPPVNRREGLNNWNGGFRFGYNYMFKHGTSSSDVTRNAHYYQNTLVLLNSNQRGLNIIPTDPSNCRVANNIAVVVNGPVNQEMRTGTGFMLDGNVYWKVNDRVDEPLVAGHSTVPSFHAATGMEPRGLGAIPWKGTNPEFQSVQFHVVDSTQARWGLDPRCESFGVADYFLGPESPAIGAAVPIPSVPGLARLPDTRTSGDIGAFPHGTDPAEYAIFPFDPNGAAPPEHQAPPTAPLEMLFERRSLWRYHDQGSDLGTSWREVGYDDRSWASGPGVFGYGESYITTQVSYGNDPLNRHPTTYFRKAFDVGDLNLVTGLRLFVTFDDGVVVYLNGTEVLRRSMPGGVITYRTRARSHESHNAYDEFDIGAHVGLLRESGNVLAAEVHQSSASSSDLVFDAELAAEHGEVVSVPADPVPAVRFGLHAWPVPYRGGDFSVELALFGGPSAKTPVEVSIFDLAGRRIRTVLKGRLSAGIHRLSWDGRDARGSAVAAGVYVLEARGGGASRSRKLVVVR